MKQFFTYVFASMLGMFLTLALFVLVVVLVIAGLVNNSTQKAEIKIEPLTILKISLSEDIPERSTQYFDSEKYKIKERVGLHEIIKDIHTAKKDANISGIYLDLNFLAGTGFASLEEIRNALIDFKASGKFIYSYSEVLSQKAYYLASTADKIYLNPEGMLEFDGLSSEYTFFKGALDKLEIEPQIFRVGKFKSFIEPFTLTKMSEANKVQVASYMGSEFTHYLEGISASRHIPVDSLRSISGKLKIQQPTDALHFRLVDALAYKDEVLEQLKKASKQASVSKLKAVTLESYASSVAADPEPSDKQIAVMYASGDIGGGEGGDNSIGSERISRLLRQVRLNDKVKALVLRVNSPGGGSMASAVIWREISLTRKVKPVVVSMGNVAASGGYFISCAANEIYAQPNTITGSIGIFAIIPNASKFFNDKLGITFDGVKTGEHSDMLTISRPLTDFEKQVVQNQINRGYQDFITKVADGRKKTVAEIDSIGQGRVWTGEQAVKIGLVDKLGSFDDAIKEAGKLANITGYTVVSYPEQKSLVESIFGDLGDQMKVYFVKQQLGSGYKYYNRLQQLREITGMQARLPFDLDIK